MAVWSKLKTYEIRENDRDFQVGDLLLLREWVPAHKANGSGEYTGKYVVARVVCMTTNGDNSPWAKGLAKDWVVMGIDQEDRGFNAKGGVDAIPYLHSI